MSSVQNLPPRYRKQPSHTLLTTPLRNKFVLTLAAVLLVPWLFLALGLMLVPAGAWKAPILLGGTLLAGLAVLTIFVVLTSRFTRQSDSIAKVLDAIRGGNYDTRAEVIADGELGGIATALNSICENTVQVIRTGEERDAIQKSVRALTRDVSLVAAGDLTVKVPVTHNMTSSIAQSVNNMISHLCEIVTHVKVATLQVNSSAAEIQKTTENLSCGSASQVTEILQTSAAIDDMAASIQAVAEHTSQSAEVSSLAREHAVNGSHAVQNTMRAMERIRDRVQDTAKRIKRLGESSQQVDDIVRMISEISDRTSILALNASIQAAMAGEAGQGFAVVAEEVERLAERSNDATKQIATLIKAIQSETAEAITAMEESTKEVVVGSNLAVEASEALAEIDSVSNRLAELIHSISVSAKQQAKGAEALSQSMGEICNVAQHSAAGTKQAAVSVSNLALLADALRASVSKFKLPFEFQNHHEQQQSLARRRVQEARTEPRPNPPRRPTPPVERQTTPQHDGVRQTIVGPIQPVRPECVTAEMSTTMPLASIEPSRHVDTVVGFQQEVS